MGGTKKSLYAANIAFHNIFKNEARTLYSTMEMSASQLGSRFINMILTDTNVNGSYELELQEKESPGRAREIVEKHIAPKFNDKLLITQNTGLMVQNYDYFLNKAVNEYGPVDILIPGGLSMMGGSGPETDLVNKHTKELNQLAIKHNIFIPLIYLCTQN